MNFVRGLVRTGGHTDHYLIITSPHFTQPHVPIISLLRVPFSSHSQVHCSSQNISADPSRRPRLSTASMDPIPDIDALLERYLALLDEYTTLRGELSRLQGATFQSLARANFAAERGVRFGQDHYDARMQAGRRVVLRNAEANVTVEVVKVDAEPVPEPETSESEEKAQEEKRAAQKKPNSKDPIRWFGLLTPLALRQTQVSAIDTVERVIPRLVTVDAEMRQLEIEVRRARKKRAKTEAAAAKKGLGQKAPRAEVAAS